MNDLLEQQPKRKKKTKKISKRKESSVELTPEPSQEGLSGEGLSTPMDEVPNSSEAIGSGEAIQAGQIGNGSVSDAQEDDEIEEEEEEEEEEELEGDDAEENEAKEGKKGNAGNLNEETPANGGKGYTEEERRQLMQVDAIRLSYMRHLGTVFETLEFDRQTIDQFREEMIQTIPKPEEILKLAHLIPPIFSISRTLVDEEDPDAIKIPPLIYSKNLKKLSARAKKLDLTDFYYYKLV